MGAVPQLPVLAAFLKRSACVLDHLALRLGNTPELKKFIRAVPSLISLSIDVDACMSKFVEVMKTNPPLLPALRILHISATYNPEYCAFIQLLQTRRHFGYQSA
jgi:hypothetical protein